MATSDTTVEFPEYTEIYSANSVSAEFATAGLNDPANDVAPAYAAVYAASDYAIEDHIQSQAPVAAPDEYVQIPVEAPAEYVQIPVEAPMQAPVEYVQISAEAPAEYVHIHVEAPAQAPVEYVQAPVEAPVQAPTQAPVEYVQAPVEAPAQAPVEYVQASAEYVQAPVEAPVQAPVQAPVEYVQAPVEVDIEVPPADLSAAVAVEPLRLKTVLLACNENKKYLDFWPVVRRAWNEIVGVRCVLVYVRGKGTAMPAHLVGDPDVIDFEAVSAWPTATQAQCIRLLYPALLGGADKALGGAFAINDAVAIGDVDMIPMQRAYYVDGFARHRADQFVSLRGVDEGCTQVYMWDVAAAPATWGEMFGVRSVADVRAILSEWARTNASDGIHGMQGGVGWCTDQILFYRKVKEWARDRPARVALEPWFAPNHRRLCRSRPVYWATPMARDTLFAPALRDAYIDFHMPEWATHDHVIEEIVGRTVARAAAASAAALQTDEIITGDRIMAAVAALPCARYFKVDSLVLGRPLVWRGRVHFPVPAKVWVTGHSDYPVTKELFERYEPNFEVWYATNVEYAHPKLRPLPIGITNCTDESDLHRIYGDQVMMAEVAAEPRALAAAPVYANFSVGTYPVERAPLLDALAGAPWADIGAPENTLEGRRRFLRAARNHKFVICPRGNGVDTHRTWETLYMGSIPILKRCAAVNSWGAPQTCAAPLAGAPPHVSGLPICFVDDWGELSEEFLAREYARLAPLAADPANLELSKLSYWVNQIANA